MPDYASLQARAEADGRRPAVAALIQDPAGRVFVHRRGWGRSLLPGCWDLVGGHVEPGESLLEGLAREIEEETGWRLAGTPALAYVADWEWDGEGRREFDFRVEVEGDPGRPRLERPQHVEFRWIGPDELDVLDENRELDGGLVRRLVELALTREPSRHVTAFVAGAPAAAVEDLRVLWDPAMASQIAAHVTLAYPAELPDALPTVAGLSPFRLRLGEIRCRGRPEEGVFVDVEDLDGGWSAARELLLGSSAGPLSVRPHVTIVHPRTTNRGPAAWRALAGARVDGETVVDELAVTAFDGRRWVTLETLRLTG